VKGVTGGSLRSDRRERSAAPCCRSALCPGGIPLRRPGRSEKGPHDIRHSERVASLGRTLIGAGFGCALTGGIFFLYRLHARGVPELNEELERALKDPRYGFKTYKDRDYVLQLSTAAAKWWMVFVALGSALTTIGVVLLLV
jgi:hypothetical protein